MDDNFSSQQELSIAIALEGRLRILTAKRDLRIHLQGIYTDCLVILPIKCERISKIQWRRSHQMMRFHGCMISKCQWGSSWDIQCEQNKLYTVQNSHNSKQTTMFRQPAWMIFALNDSAVIRCWDFMAAWFQNSDEDFNETFSVNRTHIVLFRTIIVSSRQPW